MEDEPPHPIDQAVVPPIPQAALPMQDAGFDSGEWEYEYSTTETETFLLTLDLTNPDLNHDRLRRVKQGPLRTRWINPGLGRNRPGKFLKPATYSTVSGTLLDDTHLGDDDPEADEDAEEEVETADKDGEEEIASQANLQGEIQIVDLHSDNPLITYNGSAFSCKWASHIGTELLFRAHERDSTTPILRKLNGGVDLLAVNQARIVSDPLELQPRKRKRSPERAFVRGSHIPHTKYLIPIGAHASAKRKDQAVFLERMINMKVDMGETDAVTVVAEKRLSNNRWRPRVKELRDKERAQLKKVIDASEDEESQPSVDAAKQRLQEMDDEDARVANMEPSMGKRRSAAKAARKQARTKGGDEIEEGTPAPLVEKPRRGRPPKNLHLPAAVKKALHSRISMQNIADTVEEGVAEPDDDEHDVVDVMNGHVSRLHGQANDDDGEEAFYSAQEGS